MENDGSNEFKRFIADRRPCLKRIVSATRGEHQFSDVENAAWLMAQDMFVEHGVEIAFLDRSYQEILLRHVYQKLVRYAETQVRYAVRLDHGLSDDDDEAVHPLMHTLVSDNGRDPLADLMARETAHQQSQEADGYSSLAIAYFYLLHQFDNDMRAVADYLLISESEARRHCAKAAVLAQHQRPVVMNHYGKTGFQLKAWRRFRFQRIPMQLELALLFDDELPLGQ